MSRYYENFPVAPVAVISRIASLGKAPGLVDARVCRDGGMILEILAEELCATALLDIAEAVGCPEEDAFVGSVQNVEGTEYRIYTLELLSSEFDFSPQFKDRGGMWVI